MPPSPALVSSGRSKAWAPGRTLLRRSVSELCPPRLLPPLSRYRRCFACSGRVCEGGLAVLPRGAAETGAVGAAAPPLLRRAKAASGDAEGEGRRRAAGTPEAETEAAPRGGDSVGEENGDGGRRSPPCARAEDEERNEESAAGGKGRVVVVVEGWDTSRFVSARSAALSRCAVRAWTAHGASSPPPAPPPLTSPKAHLCSEDEARPPIAPARKQQRRILSACAPPPPALPASHCLTPPCDLTQPVCREGWTASQARTCSGQRPPAQCTGTPPPEAPRRRSPRVGATPTARSSPPALRWRAWLPERPLARTRARQGGPAFVPSDLRGCRVRQC